MINIDLNKNDFTCYMYFNYYTVSIYYDVVIYISFISYSKYILFIIISILNIYIVVGPLDTAPEDVFKVSFLDYEKYLPFLYAKEKSKAASV